MPLPSPQTGSLAAARRAGRIGDGFFPASGAQVEIQPLIDLVRETAETAGRDPDEIEITTGCPGALPGPENDPLRAVAERAARGVSRIVLPLPAFLPDLEARIGDYGEAVIAKVNGG